jgi:adenosylcobinamide kinase/adenosylcobinamide-phosphate guanylyltransferase
MKILILGGARSGKSALAQQHALQSGRRVIYIATATAMDEEMRVRIARHRRTRPADWKLIEEPLALANALQENAASDHCLLVDCLTLWLNNLLAAEETRLESEKRALLSILPALSGQVILVSNEVGQGVVPANPLARCFRDEAGWLHQTVAQHCERVLFTVAGLPLTLKDTTP